MVDQPARDRGVEYLTLFAFSSENWRRPADEVSLLMRLFVTALEREVGKNACQRYPPESRRRSCPVFPTKSCGQLIARR